MLGSGATRRAFARPQTGHGAGRARTFVRAALVVCVCLALSGALLADGLALGQSAAPGQASPSSEASAQARLASRQAYRHQSDREALATVRDNFAELLDSPPLRWPPAHPGERLVGYLDDAAAIVTGPGGGAGVLESSIPLRGRSPDGERAPIDLALVDVGRSYVPKSAAADVRIPATSRGSLRFPDQSFSVSLDGADEQPATISQNKAFFANVATDSDLVLEPRAQGAELSVVLRSPEAPASIPLVFDLAPGQRLRSADTTDGVPVGSVVVADGSKRVAAVYAAVAADADGKPLPVTYRIRGDRLLMDVDTSGDLKYPLLVDPPFGIYDNNGNSTGAGTAGYTWPNWDPATYLEGPGDPTTTWSFCNNGPSNPNKKFYFCQGSTTGAAASGGPLYIKANANQPYAGTDWAQWFKQARPDSYIYKFDASLLSNFAPAKAALAVGVRTAAGTSWEDGSVLWANGDTSTGDAPAGQAGYRTPSGTALIGATRYIDVHNGTPAPPTPIVPGNKAVLRMFMTAGTPGNNPLPYVQMNGAATYSSELYAPTLAAPTHTTPVPAGWVKNYTDTVSVGATDRGLGMGTITTSGPSGSGLSASKSACTANGGPGGTSANNLYDACALSLTLPGTTYTAPEGTTTYTATATDLVGNSSTAQSKSWTVRVDRTGPQGSLDPVAPAVRGTITVTGTMTDPLSGRQDWKLQYQAPGNVTWQDVCTPQTSATGSYGCSWNTTGVGDGTYKLRAEMRDSVPAAAGGPNVSWTPTLNVLVDNTAPDLLQDIAPAVGSEDYSEELTDSNVTEASFTQHDTGSGVAQTTLEYNTATDGSDLGTWESAVADPATGDGDVSTFWSTEGLDEGLHRVRATTVDAVGNPRVTTFQVLKQAARKPCAPQTVQSDQRCYAGFAVGTPKYTLKHDTTGPACTKWAGPGGADTPSNGSSGAPYLTAAYLISRLTSGDVGCLKANAAGYQLNTEADGTITASNVTLETAPGTARQTLKGRLWLKGNNVTVRELKLDGRNLLGSNCKWEATTVTSCPKFSPEVTGNDDKLIDNEITSVGTPGETASHNNCVEVRSYNGVRPQRAIIKDNVIHDCGFPTDFDENGGPGDPRVEPGGHWHGIYVVDGDATQIFNNKIYRNADRGIQLYHDAQGTKIHHNTIFNNGAGINISIQSAHTRVTNNIVSDSLKGTDDATYHRLNPDRTGNYPYGNPNHTIYNIYTEGSEAPEGVDPYDHDNDISGNCLWESYNGSNGAATESTNDEVNAMLTFQGDKNAHDPEFVDPTVPALDLQARNPVCFQKGENPSGYHSAYGVRSMLTTGDRPANTPSGYSQAIGARLASPTRKNLMTGVTDGFPCKDHIKPGKWTAFYRWTQAGGVTHTQCIKDLALAPGATKPFWAFVGKDGSKVVDKVKVPKKNGAVVMTIPRKGSPAFLSKPAIAEVFGVTNKNGRALSGQFASIKYATAVAPTDGDWVVPDAAHSFPITSCAAGYKIVGSVTGFSLTAPQVAEACP